jgi:hypothetical protein
MRDWLTYRLSDFLLFSARTYYRMFELYHRDIWPAQIASLLVAVVIVAALVRPLRYREPLVWFALSAAWLWVGIAFIIRRYASINWAATYFGALFSVQAVMMLVVGARSWRLESSNAPRATDRRAAVAFLIAVALAPVVGMLTGRTWQQVELFGLTPDATAVATVALLAFARERRRLLLIVPLAWCGIGAATLWALGSREAWLSVIAAVVALASLISRRPNAV